MAWGGLRAQAAPPFLSLPLGGSHHADVKRGAQGLRWRCVVCPVSQGNQVLFLLFSFLLNYLLDFIYLVLFDLFVFFVLFDFISSSHLLAGVKGHPLI